MNSSKTDRIEVRDWYQDASGRVRYRVARREEW